MRTFFSIRKYTIFREKRKVSYGFVWFRMDSYGFVWIRMDSYGRPARGRVDRHRAVSGFLYFRIHLFSFSIGPLIGARASLATRAEGLVIITT